MSAPPKTRGDIAVNAACEFGLTTVLLFGVVTTVRWLADPLSPLAIANPRILFTVAGLVVAVLIAALMYSPPGRRSGGHMHAGVSVFVWLNGRLPGRAVAPYVVAQLAGSLVGTALARLVWGPEVARLGYAAVHPRPSLGSDGLVLAETLPLLVVFAAVTACLRRPAWMRFVPIVIGVGVGLSIALLASVSGASINPSRQFGPALLSGVTGELWIYLLVPIAAPALVALVARSTPRATSPAPAR
ncbi:aquaporin [Streptomyces sp. NPDC088387]|uniref:aquaporin n=1 Tax=Streptomyces sp. NPDC088387 TaxID=3365859 RepID=UPI00380987F4